MKHLKQHENQDFSIKRHKEKERAEKEKSSRKSSDLQELNRVLEAGLEPAQPLLAKGF